jgi:hypothetical protein
VDRPVRSQVGNVRPEYRRGYGDDHAGAHTQANASAHTQANAGAHTQANAGAHTQANASANACAHVDAGTDDVAGRDRFAERPARGNPR